MPSKTPFFTGFNSVLFGRAPVAARELIARARAASDTLCHSGLEALFGGFFPPGLLRKPGGSRDRVFTVAVTFWTFLSQVLDPSCPCTKAVARLGALFSGAGLPVPSGATGAYCKARFKLPVRMLLEINRHVAGMLCAGTRPAMDRAGAGSIRTGNVFVLDGSGLSMPDTPENQAKYPQRSTQEPGCGFPEMQIVGLFDLLSGAWVATAKSDHRPHESRLMRRLYRHLKPGDTLVTDRGFCSYWSVAELSALGVEVVMRNHQMRKSDFRRGTRLGRRDHLTTWEKPQRPEWMDAETYAAMPAQIVLRETDISVARDGYRTKKIVLVSTFLDAGEKPVEDLAELYRKRWRVELFFDDIKTTMGMDVLRTKSPGMVCRELLVHMIAYNLMRCLVARSGASPQRTSFKRAADRCNVWAPQIMACPPGKKRDAAVAELLAAVAAGKVPVRLYRREPRVKKRRPKTYQLMTKPRSKMIEQEHRGKRRKLA